MISVRLFEGGHGSPFRPALGAALVVLVVSAALAGESGRASAESEESPGPGTTTTVLQRGWNMVGWLGPEARATDLFEAIPALVRAYAWNAAEQRYQHTTRNSTSRDGPRQLTTGMGLWLQLGGDAPFGWTRPASARSTLLSLRAGRNLVGWAGRDGTAIEDAVARFGESVVRTFQWDAEAQAFEHYRPGESDSANTLAELNHGDALWVELTGDARWWQSGTSETEFEFTSDVSPERQAELRKEMASVQAFFAERYGVEPPEFSVVEDPSLGPFAATAAGRIMLSTAAATSGAIAGASPTSTSISCSNPGNPSAGVSSSQPG